MVPHVLREEDGSRYLALLPLLEKKTFFHFFGIRPSGRSADRGEGFPVPGSPGPKKENPFSFRIPGIELKQVHSDRIRVHRKGDPVVVNENRGQDGVVSDEESLCLQVATADCVPLLFFDATARAAGAVHAGWRGTASRISEKAVEAMAFEFGCRPEDLSVGIGPSIGPCCYDVGEEVFHALEKEFSNWESYIRHREGPKGRLDLWKLNRDQLTARGVRKENIFSAGLCTHCRPDLFFSYRREGPRSGRMISGVVIQKEGVR